MLSQLSDKQLPKLLAEGAVGVLPTDTTYGLVCSAANEAAVSRLYGIKQSKKEPGTVIAADFEQLVELGIPRRYLKAVEQFWPGPISIIIPSGQNLAYLHLGKQGLAVRIPKAAALSKLLKETGPLLTTSANPPGKKPAGTIADAQKYFGEKLDFYVDSGDLSDRLPSTIIRIIDDAIEVVRPGAVKINEAGSIDQ